MTNNNEQTTMTDRTDSAACWCSAPAVVLNHESETSEAHAACAVHVSEWGYTMIGAVSA